MLLHGGGHLGYFQWFWLRHLCSGFCVSVNFQFTGVNEYLGIGLLGVWLRYTLRYFNNCHMVFQSGCAVLQSPATYDSPVILHPHRYLVRSVYFPLGYSNRCVVVFRCGFNSHFPND